MTEDDRDDPNPYALPAAVVAPPATKSARRATEPHGATARFVASVREDHGDAYVRSWLSGQTCQFDDSTIWTGDFARDTLMRDCHKIIKTHGVVIACDQQSRAHFRGAA